VAENVVDVVDLNKSYGANHVLRDVNLQIPRGAVVGLMGLNGAGKTTLLQCLLGLLRPDSGQSQLLGYDAWELPPSAKERLGFVPQVVNLFPWMKARHVLRYTAAFYSNWDDRWASELATRWRLPLDTRVQALSTGQAHTLALVLALAPRPELLVLDEPVSTLDPIARREFLRSLLELTNAGSRTVLFSTHISSDLERVATHIAILRDGQITCFSELDDLKDRVKRLRLSSEDRLPNDLLIPGSLRTTVDGRTALAAVTDVTPELLDNLRDLWQADVRVEDLNLEEIFVELNTHA
jgi:ABC-2 type transport system ATP-binding protein